MKTNHALRLLGLAGLGALLATPALAQDGGYYYGGLSVGQSNTKIDDDRVIGSLLGTGLSTTALTRDEHDTAYRIFGGYQFNRYFGLEAGYFNLGKFGFKAITAPAGSLYGQFETSGLNLDLVGTLPLGEKLSAIGRVGAQWARTRAQFDGTGAVAIADPNPSVRDTNYKVGVGLQYAFSPSFLMRVEGERYRVNDTVGSHGNADVYSVSLVFPFGRTATPAPRAAAPAYVPPAPVAQAPAPMPAPAPVVVAPVPAPVYVAPPPPPAPTKVSFSADSLFGFDKSAVRPEGKAALDTFAGQLKGTSYSVVNVEGHTDRLGTSAYNQKLSVERAEAVKTYLVSNGGLDAGKVSTVGKGETMPVTKPEDCKGHSATPKLIACLQPDRRVDVEVDATR
jgi:OOP family OmpA-OmpF porin